jgi:uncharacterized protein with LGFP repeats
MRRLVPLALSVVVAAGIVSVPLELAAPQARALSGSQFNAGSIISDQAFYDSSAMTAGQIQSFLNSKVSSCRNGYTCLKDYWQASTSRPADANCSAYSGTWESAATIIDRVARACGVSQKVLLVLLQKEQGLITDTWPLDSQYRAATGYGCPDTAPCDAEYYGFFNQVYNAAWQFRQYRAKPERFGYRAGRVNFIRWHPNSACGGGNVYITNQATAGLYNYTPYQPNAAALSNLYGTGDGCSSYGNRNFWRMYTDWFGSTNAFAVSGGIGEFYITRGGSSGSGLGEPIGNQYRLPDGIGWAQHFQHGEIFWSPQRGAFISIGGIGVTLTGSGGPVGAGVGYATGDQTPYNDAAAGWFQDFERGVVTWRPSDGGRVVRGAIANAYRDAGAATGALGYPLGDEHGIAGGRAQAFESGTLYSNGSSTILVPTAIAEIIQRDGGLSGTRLGLPMSTASAGPAGGLAQTFAVGGVYWSSSTGGWVVGGGIGMDYAQWGGPSGSGLGYPIGAQLELGSKLSGWVQRFENGAILWSPATGSVRVTGGIGIALDAWGGPFGSGLGYPTANAVASGSVVTQRFQHGSIRWTLEQGAVLQPDSGRIGIYADGSAMPVPGAVAGARTELVGGAWSEPRANGTMYHSSLGDYWTGGGIGEHYARLGGAMSSLGLPVGNQFPLGDRSSGWQQRFQYGTIWWSPATGAHSLNLTTSAGFEAAGGPTGSVLGYPITDSTTDLGGGAWSHGFQVGALYSTSSGTWSVPGGIGSDYARLGGVSSTVGLPSGRQVEHGNGGWSQQFSNGTIYWSGATGSVVVTGAIADALERLDGPEGSGLGYPTAPAQPSGAGAVQAFQYGGLIATPTSTQHVPGGIGIDWQAAGGAAAPVGLPIYGQHAVGDGGWAQEFTGGWAYWSPTTGTHFGLGGIGEYFVGLGGSVGSGLGYPTSEQFPTGGGYWVQRFQRGSITWVPNFGGTLG